MSLLLRDPIGATATNCVETEKPADIYGIVADRTTERLMSEVRSGGDYAEIADAWLRLCGGEIPRKATKRIVMTVPYSSQPHSHQGYVSEFYFELVRQMDFKSEPFPSRSTYKACDYLARQIRESLLEATAGAKVVMDYLRELAVAAAENGQHMSWTAPTGLRVVQRYRKSNKRTVTVSAGRRVKVHMFDEVDAVDKNKSANAISPNFIHSLDAAAATLVVDEIFEQGAVGFQAIHDSFATHAADAPALARAIRASYIQVFSEDLLEKIREETTLNLPSGTVLPEPPTKGNLNINCLSEATYFFN
jgi:DNA-directed RNA polymerase